MDKLKDRLTELERIFRSTYASLRSTVKAYSFKTDLGRIESSSALLADAAQRIHALIPMRGYAFFLNREEDPTFQLSHHAPRDMAEELQAEFDNLADLDIVPMILDTSSVLPRKRRKGEGHLLAHSLSTPSRIRGLFIGLPEADYQDLPEGSTSLLSVILIQCSASLESFELYHLHRRANQKIKDQIRLLDQEILERRRAQSALLESERSYRSLVNNIPVGMCRTTMDGELKILMANQALARMLEMSDPEQLIGRSFTDFMVSRREIDRLKGILKQSRPLSSFEIKLAARNSSLWVNINGRPMCSSNSPDDVLEMVLEDVTEQRVARERTASMHAELEKKVRVRTRELEEANRMVREALSTQEAYFRKLFNNSPLGIVLTTPEGHIMESNDTFCQMFGYAPDAIKGIRLIELICRDKDSEEAQADLTAAVSGEHSSRDCKRLTSEATPLPVYHLTYPVQVADRTDGIVHAFQNISERKRMEERLTHLAFHDPLTSLPNRSLLQERLAHAINRSHRRSDYQFALLMADLNRFKTVNDSLGHPAGDELLIKVADRLVQCVRDVDTVARLGGDEFAILLEEFQSPHEVLAVADRIKGALEQSFPIAGEDVVVGISIGIVLKTRDYDSPQDILRDADIAMYRAKKERGSNFKVFSNIMHSQAMNTLRLESDLRATLERDFGLLVNHYQPVMSLETNTLVGFETLVRWQHPEFGPLAPDKFIPMAEESGLIHRLGEQVFRLACRDLAHWRTLTELPSLMLSINLSGHQLDQKSWPSTMASILSEYRIETNNLKLELTESSVMSRSESRIHRLSELKDMGMQIMIDDFGTGYSSLSHLKNLPVDFLKIDRSFISGQSTIEMEAIVRAVISMCKQLGLVVVAEGVELRTQHDFLCEHACDLAQGFLYSKPLNPDQALAFLLRHPPAV